MPGATSRVNLRKRAGNLAKKGGKFCCYCLQFWLRFVYSLASFVIELPAATGPVPQEDSTATPPLAGPSSGPTTKTARVSKRHASQPGQPAQGKKVRHEKVVELNEPVAAPILPLGEVEAGPSVLSDEPPPLLGLSSGEEHFYHQVGGASTTNRSSARSEQFAQAWAELLPSLVYPMLEQMARHSSGRSRDEVGPMPQCQMGCSVKQYTTSVVGFESRGAILSMKAKLILSAIGIHEITYNHCACHSPATVLLHHGCFSSTPRRAPKWAFDLRLLEYASLQFLHGAPNIAAWCHATVSFLHSNKVPDLPTPVSTFIPLAK